MSDQEGDQVLTTAETLALLQVSKPTLYRMMDEGVLAPLPSNPILMRPKRLLFRRADVERILREGRKPPKAAAD